MVRFREVLNHRTEELSDWRVGLCVKYESWEKIVEVLYKGKMLRLRAEYVTKAGKKDYEG